MVYIHQQKQIDKQTRLSICGIETSSETVASIYPQPQADKYFPELITHLPHLIRPSAILPVATDVTRHIRTRGSPVSTRPRHLAPDKLKVAKPEFEQMLEICIIRPSENQWASPLHMVPKKTGDRVVIIEH
ncbi:unnamed protein product [Dicrocoelium dendriticum]|nr:unnamed protein product [Dicrocoelium dendriticum]